MAQAALIVVTAKDRLVVVVVVFCRRRLARTDNNDGIAPFGQVTPRRTTNETISDYGKLIMVTVACHFYEKLFRLIMMFDEDPLSKNKWTLFPVRDST